MELRTELTVELPMLILLVSILTFEPTVTICLAATLLVASNVEVMSVLLVVLPM
jgi:hypothetical protein